MTLRQEIAAQVALIKSLKKSYKMIPAYSIKGLDFAEAEIKREQRKLTTMRYILKCTSQS